MIRITIVLDLSLIQEAFHYTTVKTKRELVEIALREFISRHKRRNILELKEKVKIYTGYDYKKLRKG